MRRGISIAVLLVVLTIALVPLWRAYASSGPACCRAGGSHHCEMSIGGSGLSGFKSAPDACPYRIHAAVTSQPVALTAARHRIAVFILGRETAQPTKVAHFANYSDDADKRGPPAA